MKPIDDQILEFLVDETVATPKLVADSLDYNNDYITSRFSELTNFGLTLRVSRGVYRLTDEGESYLAGELDASELETDEGN